MAFDKISAFHPNPQVRRMREHDAAAQPEKPAASEGHDSDTPAKAVEIHRHDDGSYHSITHKADGKKEKKEHASHEEAMDQAKSSFHEDGGDGMEQQGGDDGMQSEEQTPCPDCNGEGCESCGGTGIKKSEGEEY